MKIVFFGTPDYALPILDGLHKAFVAGPGKSPIVAVVTQKPAPVGREQKVTYSPVDAWAHKRRVPVFYDFEKLPEADLGVCAAFGKIIPEFVIRNFKFGILNVHPSLLPKYRGASPVQAAIVNGDTETGVSIIRLDEKLDHGPIISQFKEEILPTDTAGTLRARLFERSTEVLVALIEPYLAGKIKSREQNLQEASFTTQVKKEEGFIPPEYLSASLQGLSLEKKWEIPFIKNYSLAPNVYSIERSIRAMDPWPGAWSTVKIMANGQWLKRRLKILKAHLDIKHQSLILDLVQLEGKTPVSWEEFKRGYPNAEFAKE